MAKQKRATATVKMTYTEDSDLIAWWHSLPRGSRNAIMKDMMRHYIEHHRGSYRPLLPRNRPQPFEPGRFTQLCDDTAWIRATLQDLPGYVEQIIQQVAAHGLSHQRSPMGTDGSPRTAVSDEATARRAHRMKQAPW